MLATGGVVGVATLVDVPSFDVGGVAVDGVVVDEAGVDSVGSVFVQPVGAKTSARAMIDDGSGWRVTARVYRDSHPKGEDGSVRPKSAQTASAAKAASAAASVCSMIASSWATETNAASNCEGGM